MKHDYIFVMLSILGCLVYSEECLCDTTSVCDLLCCCDLDCNTDEKTSFRCDTSILNNSSTDKVCFSQSLFSRYTVGDAYSVTTEDENYCFSYLSPVTFPSTATKSLKASSIDLRNSKLPLTYSKDFKKIALNRQILMADDPVYVHSEESGINRPLTLPADFRSSCVLDSVLYLRNSSSNCLTKITSEICQSGSKVDGSGYEGLKFLSNFRNFSTFNDTTKEVQFGIIEVVTTCHDESGATVTCLPPTVDSINCLNVLYQIDLVITHTTSIQSAVFKLYLKSVVIGSTSNLATKLTFESVTDEYLIVGPRYQRYKPKYGVVFNASNKKTFFTPFQSDTRCRSSRRIEFPFSTIASCSKEINLDNTDFPALVTVLFSALPIALAKYYNSDLSKSDEWLALEWQIPEVLNSTNVPTFVEITIKHKSFGSRIYPENEITSVSTSVSTSNLKTLNDQKLLSDEIVFYFSVRFLSVDPEEFQEEHIFDRLYRTFPNYSVPFRMLFITAVIFVILSIGILIREQGKPEF